MIGIYLGVFIFVSGIIITLSCRNIKVPMNGDFWDMPICIKVGILAIIGGALLICASVMFVLLKNPMILLN